MGAGLWLEMGALRWAILLPPVGRTSVGAFRDITGKIARKDASREKLAEYRAIMGHAGLSTLLVLSFAPLQ